jgi:hypothetical protein
VLATPVLVVYATSGTGKSSLLNAGLVPALDKDPSLLTLVIAEPNADVGSLLRDRLSEAGWDGVGVPGDGGLSDILKRHFEATHRRVVLILDQFEERIKRSTTLDELYDDVARLANTRSEAATVVLAIREDYVMSLEPLLRRIVGLLDASYRVPSLTRAELMKAVTGPLAAVGGGVSPEPGLVEEVLADLERVRSRGGVRSGMETAGLIEPGFFQIVWHYLWEKDATSPGSRLTLRTYEEAGRATGIIRANIDRILEELTPHEAEVLRAAIRYLAPPSGAKVAITVNGLVDWLRDDDFTSTGKGLFPVGDQEIVRLLLDSLVDQLTRPGTALLRRVVRDGQVEFELVHDLVGKNLQDWRERYPDELAETGRQLVAEVEVFEQPAKSDEPPDRGQMAGAIGDVARTLTGKPPEREHVARTIDEVTKTLTECRRRLEGTLGAVSELEEIGTELRGAFGRCARLGFTRHSRVDEPTASALPALTKALAQVDDALRKAALEPSSPPEDRRRFQRMAWEYGELYRATVIPEVERSSDDFPSEPFPTGQILIVLASALLLALAGAFGARQFIEAFVPIPDVEYVPMTVAFYIAGTVFLYLWAADESSYGALLGRLLFALFPRDRQDQLFSAILFPIWWPFHFLLFELTSFAGAWLFQALGWTPTAGFHLAAIPTAFGIGFVYSFVTEEFEVKYLATP